MAASPPTLAQASKIILPGVGAFDQAMTRLNGSGMRPVLDDLVLGEGRPVLGICVGMQMMASESEEGSSAGLGWIRGTVGRLDTSGLKEKPFLPHLGWNTVEVRRNHALFAELDGSACFYFLHSYAFSPQHKDDVLSETEYGGKFVSSVGCGNVCGVQFHPEKSHQWGISLLKNFAEA